MKSSKISSWVVLLNVGALAACGGVSSIGSGDSGGSPGMAGAPSKAGAPGMETKGGRGGTSGMEGTGTAGRPFPGMGGSAAMPGTGASTGLQACMTDHDCPDAGESCEVCADGTLACNVGYCDATSGICKRKSGLCTPKCATDMDCPILDLPCTECGDGSRVCPISQCRMGFCEASYPGCGGHDPCAGRECGSPCDSCPPDGMCESSELSFCSAAGKCQPGPASCGENICQTSMDCGTPPPVCVHCPDGTCAGFGCVSNKCAYNCPTTTSACEVSEDCTFDLKCSKCPSGECAVPACIQNTCDLVCPLD
jgi:hypothetical protein